MTQNQISRSNQASHGNGISRRNQTSCSNRTSRSSLTSRSNHRNIIWYIVAGVGIFLFFLTGMQYIKRLRLQQEIADKIVRFHVLANSDTEADQNLKLAVRDAVGIKMGELLVGAGSREACETIINDQMGEIIITAEQVVADEGYDYGVQAFLADVDFPVKTYGDYTFPAGKYEALEVVIGEGEGRNWWCVMYPNMCFSGSVYEVVDEEAEESLQEVLSPEEYEAVLQSGDYEVQFRYLTFLNDLR